MKQPNRPFETYQNRVAAFEAQQKQSAPAKTAAPTKPTDTQNPYLRARIEILNKYPEWRRNEVREMERTGDINNAHYDAFVHEVALLGDTYMPIC